MPAVYQWSSSLLAFTVWCWCSFSIVVAVCAGRLWKWRKNCSLFRCSTRLLPVTSCDWTQLTFTKDTFIVQNHFGPIWALHKCFVGQMWPKHHELGLIWFMACGVCVCVCVCVQWMWLKCHKLVLTWSVASVVRAIRGQKKIQIGALSGGSTTWYTSSM